MSEGKIFADGMIVKRRENAPSFVLASLSIKSGEFYEFMKKHTKDGWLNIDILLSKNDKPYAALNTFKPNQTQGQGFGGRQEPSQQPGGRNAGYGQETNDQQWEQSRNQKEFEDDMPF